MIVALRDGIYTFDTESEALVALARPEPERTANRFNDATPRVLLAYTPKNARRAVRRCPSARMGTGGQTILPLSLALPT